MAKVYLLDWGDTLMVDIPGQAGKMCDWARVEAVEGAREALACLSRENQLYVATNAAESSPADIQAALARVDLSRYISGYFCRANVGCGKGSPDYYLAILKQLCIDADRVTMVGDSFENDILPALEAGLSAVWLHAAGGAESSRLRIINSMRDLCIRGCTDL